jgi:penicillin amidase
MLHSTTSRIIKAVNIAIAVLAVVALAAVYWFCWRPLPRRSGHIVTSVAAPVSVEFDARGIPHIHASSTADALFVQGYVTAQDRLWQMDALRRYSAGELSEVLGPSTLETDRESRRLRLRRLSEIAYTALPPADRAALGAYVRGVNAFIDTHRGDLPVEFTLLGYQPRPWSAVDSLLIGAHMFRTLTTSWRDEIDKRTLRAEGDPRKVDFLFPVRAGTEPMPGSNGWAVAGSHTASGKPILSNDMHLEYSLPGIWYMAHLQSPDLNVSGVALPGLPGIVVGHNARIAWGITNLEFDVQDLYIEKLDERTGQYLYRGHLEQARLEREIIRVKGQKSEELPIWVTRHGPIFLDDHGTTMALRWILAEPGTLQYPVLDIDRAQNWQQFTAALERFAGPGSNFVYADVDGNIGYHAAGKLPIRRGYLGDVPVDANQCDCDWDGFIPFDKLPSVFNPPSGIIATANQNPFPLDYPYPVSGGFAPPYRVNQIRARLRARQGWQAGDMLSVQMDVYASLGKFLASQLVAAYAGRNVHAPNLDEAVAMLRAWNGQMDIRGGAPFLIALAYQHVQSAIAANAAPASTIVYRYHMATSVVEKLLRERPSGWFADYDAMLRQVLVDAVEEGERIQGRDLKRWQYGNYSQVAIDPPVIHQVPWAGKYFDIGPLPIAGWSITVKQVTRRLAPSMRMNADLANWDRSLLNVVTGESGQIFSSHYKDEWKAWYTGRSYPMEFGKVEPASTLEFRPQF